MLSEQHVRHPPIGNRLVLAALSLFALSLSCAATSWRTSTRGAAGDGRLSGRHGYAGDQQPAGHGGRRAAVSAVLAGDQRAVRQASPRTFCDDEKFATMFMLVDVQLVGVLLVVELGNRDAARGGLVPIEETLSRLSARSAPISAIRAAS